MDNPALTAPQDSSVLDDLDSSSMHNGQSSKERATDHSITGNIIVSKYDQGWRRIVRNFSPSWFSVTMGTGIVANIFIIIPFKAAWLYYLGIVFFALTVVLFGLAMAASILRYTIWPEIWTVMIEDSTNSLFLGTVPMGFATIVELWIFVCVPAWGPWAAYVGWAMWMLDSVVAISVTVGLGILLQVASNDTYTRHC